MSKLLDQIKQDLLQARKDKDTLKSGCLSTLVGECMTKQKTASADKPFTDGDVQGVIKKSLKNLSGNLSLSISSEAKETFQKELSWLEGYMPKMMSEEELSTAIRGILINSTVHPVTVGYVMGQLKKEYAGKYDGALAKKVFDSIGGA